MGFQIHKHGTRPRRSIRQHQLQVASAVHQLCTVILDQTLKARYILFIQTFDGEWHADVPPDSALWHTHAAQPGASCSECWGWF